MATAGARADAIYIGRGSKWAIRFASALMATARRLSPNTSAGCEARIICYARATSFATAICSASAQQRHVMVICCCAV
jgi:hypothetical protein